MSPDRDDTLPAFLARHAIAIVTILAIHNFYFSHISGCSRLWARGTRHPGLSRISSLGSSNLPIPGHQTFGSFHRPPAAEEQREHGVLRCRQQRAHAQSPQPPGLTRHVHGSGFRKDRVHACQWVRLSTEHEPEPCTDSREQGPGPAGARRPREPTRPAVSSLIFVLSVSLGRTQYRRNRQVRKTAQCTAPGIFHNDAGFLPRA